MKIAEVALKEKNLNNQMAKGATPRANDTSRNEQVSRPNQPSVQRPVRQIGSPTDQGGPTGGANQ